MGQAAPGSASAMTQAAKCFCLFLLFCFVFDCRMQRPEAILGRDSVEDVLVPLNHFSLLELWICDGKGSLKDVRNAFGIIL